jgi:hypothetical protein
VISLGGRSFAGPFMAPLWQPAATGGVYAVMVPGWRLMTFRALHFAASADFSKACFRQHRRYAEWLSIAGSEWNLYIAVHAMASSTATRRLAAERAMARNYVPEFNEPVLNNKE